MLNPHNTITDDYLSYLSIVRENPIILRSDVISANDAKLSSPTYAVCFMYQIQ